MFLFHPIKAKWGQQNTFILLNYQLCLLGKTFHRGISRTNNSYQYKNINLENIKVKRTIYQKKITKNKEKGS